MRLREALATPVKLYPPYYQRERYQSGTYSRSNGSTFFAFFEDEHQGQVINEYHLFIQSPTGFQQWDTFDTIEELEWIALWQYGVPIDEGWTIDDEPTDVVPEETLEERALSLRLADLIPSDEDWVYQGDE